MNIKNFFEIQKKLDKEIEKEHKINPKEVLDKKIIALYIEVAEFANEISSFKYWKKNKNFSLEKSLEEYADCIHFFMTLYVYKNIKEKNIKHSPIEDINEMFLKLFMSISKLKENLSEKNLDYSFGLLLGIGDNLNFDWKEIEKYYLLKNKINYNRLKNNY